MSAIVPVKQSLNSRRNHFQRSARRFRRKRIDIFNGVVETNLNFGEELQNGLSDFPKRSCEPAFESA